MMQISSAEGNAHIALEPNDPQDEFSDFSFVAQRYGLNQFVGRNDVVFYGLDDFLVALEELVLNRNVEASLRMSEECSLVFFRWNAVGDIGIRATIRNYGFSTDTSRSDKYTVEFEFKIDGEFLNTMLADFKKLSIWK